MPQVVFHESESVRKPDCQSEVQNERQRKREPKVEGCDDYMCDVVVLAAIRWPQQVKISIQLIYSHYTLN
jgi:hypothetical protein